MTHRPTFRTLLTLLLAATSVSAAAKSSHSASTLPKNPAALLAVAAQQNGLAGPNLKPWHIKATYQLYDAKGNPTQKGTFEEWWAAPNQYKITFDRPGHKFALYVTPKGSYSAGSNEMQSSEFQLEKWLLDPVPEKVDPKTTRLIRKTEKSGKMKFDCVEVIPLPHGGFVNGESWIYCLSKERPILRFAENMSNEGILYRSIARIQGHFLGQDLTISQNGVPVVTTHLISGEVLTHRDDSLFALPPEAKGHLHPTLTIANGLPTVVEGRHIGGRVPVYPSVAKIENQQGTVELRGLIGTDGKIHKLKVISSPSLLLSRSAVDAVKTWRYKPFTLGGIPVQVETTINIVFSLGGGM